MRKGNFEKIRKKTTAVVAAIYILDKTNIKTKSIITW